MNRHHRIDGSSHHRDRDQLAATVDQDWRPRESRGAVATDNCGDCDVVVVPDFGVDVAVVVANSQLAAGRQVDADLIIGVGCCRREGYKTYKAQKDLLNLQEHLGGDDSKRKRISPAKAQRKTEKPLRLCAFAGKIYGSIKSSIEVGSFAGLGGAAGGGAPAKSEILSNKLLALVAYGNAVSILTTPSLIKCSITV